MCFLYWLIISPILPYKDNCLRMCFYHCLSPIDLSRDITRLLIVKQTILKTRRTLYKLTTAVTLSLFKFKIVFYHCFCSIHLSWDAVYHTFVNDQATFMENSRSLNKLTTAIFHKQNAFTVELKNVFLSLFVLSTFLLRWRLPHVS